VPRNPPAAYSIFPLIGLVMLARIGGRAVVEPVCNEELVDRI
jgi:hypothetical protein